MFSLTFRLSSWLSSFLIVFLFCVGCFNIFSLSNPYKVVSLEIVSMERNSTDTWIYDAKGTITVTFAKEPSQPEIDNMSKNVGVGMYVYNKGNSSPKYYLQTGMKGKYPELYTTIAVRISAPYDCKKSESSYLANWEFKNIWFGNYTNNDHIYDAIAVTSDRGELEKLSGEKWLFMTYIKANFFYLNNQETNGIPENLVKSLPYEVRRD